MIELDPNGPPVARGQGHILCLRCRVEEIEAEKAGAGRDIDRRGTCRRSEGGRR